MFHQAAQKKIGPGALPGGVQNSTSTTIMMRRQACPSVSHDGSMGRYDRLLVREVRFFIFHSPKPGDGVCYGGVGEGVVFRSW